MCRQPCGDVQAAIWWVVGGPCDFSVSPSPFGLDFGTLGLWTLDFRLWLNKKHLKTFNFGQETTQKRMEQNYPSNLLQKQRELKRPQA